MALIKCPECQKKISDKAQTCIYCGYPINQQVIVNNTQTKGSNRVRGKCPKCGKEMHLLSCRHCGYHDYKKEMEIMHRMVMEDKEKREQKKREENGIIKAPPSAAGLDTQEYIDNLDIPGSMDDGVALLLYIVVMVVGAIFNDRWLIWIFATIVYLCHIFRRQIHKAKWEREHKNKK